MANPIIDKMTELKHFAILNQTSNQMVMSSGQYFGDNADLDPLFEEYLNIYSQLYEHLLITKHNRKEKLHAEIRKNCSCGYYDEGGMLMFGIGSSVCDL